MREKLRKGSRAAVVESSPFNCYHHFTTITTTVLHIPINAYFYINMAEAMQVDSTDSTPATVKQEDTIAPTSSTVATTGGASAKAIAKGKAVAKVGLPDGQRFTIKKVR